MNFQWFNQAESETGFWFCSEPVNNSVQCPVPSFLSVASSVQSPASKVQRPESSVQSPACKVQRPESSVQSPAFRVQHFRLESRNSGMPCRSVMSVIIKTMCFLFYKHNRFVATHTLAHWCSVTNDWYQLQSDLDNFQQIKQRVWYNWL